MRILAAIILITCAPLTAAAQSTTSSPSTPRPAHERLAVFEGTWRSTDPADSAGFVEVCSWLEGGRRHMICNARRQTPAGAVEHRTIYSYRGRDSTYVVTALLATGQVWTYLGRPDDSRWIFNLQSDRPDNPQRLRMIVTVARDTIHFIEESSENGGPWRVTEDYRHVRVTERGPDLVRIENSMSEIPARARAFLFAREVVFSRFGLPRPRPMLDDFGGGYLIVETQC